MELQRQHGVGVSVALLPPQQQPPSLGGRGVRPGYDHAAILSLDQIKAIRSHNEYTEGPSVVRRPPPPRTGTSRPPPSDKRQQERTHEVILVNVNNNYEPRGVVVGGGVVVVAGGGGSRAPPGLSRSTSSGSNSSASSEQGLLARSPPPPSRPGLGGLQNLHLHRSERPVRTQPKPKAFLPPQNQNTPHHPAPPPLDAPLKLSGKGEESTGAGHQFICEHCGKCVCGECTAPRSPPPCLARAGTLLEHATCMCLVRGVFYHCSNDDQGDSCADHPCSLWRAHFCQRFLCMGLLAGVFPCLLCYPPLRACLGGVRQAHDRLTRPGCRCKNSNTVYCRLDPRWTPPPQSLQKPPS